MQSVYSYSFAADTFDANATFIMSTYHLSLIKRNLSDGSHSDQEDCSLCHQLLTVHHGRNLFLCAASSAVETFHDQDLSVRIGGSCRNSVCFINACVW